MNIIAFEHLTARRPEARRDLPAGGRRLVREAEGYLHTFAVGEVTGAANAGAQLSP